MKPTILEWARREIDLATAGEDFDLKEEIDKHYEAAYQAFCDFCKHVEGLDKPGIVKTIFTQLLNENPLTPIENNEDDWDFVEGFDPEHDDSYDDQNPEYSFYRCNRRPSLWKKVTYGSESARIRYSDMERSVCVDVNSENMYTGGMGPVVLDEMYPINLPYSPIGKIKIFTEDFKCHEDFDGDFDTVGILYFRMPDGQVKEVKRYFKEDHKIHEMIEIGLTEYLSRKKKSESWKKRRLKED